MFLGYYYGDDWASVTLNDKLVFVLALQNCHLGFVQLRSKEYSDQQNYGKVNKLASKKDVLPSKQNNDEKIMLR